MKKVIVSLFLVGISSLLANEQVSSPTFKIIACGQGTEKQSEEIATFDWYLFEDNVLLIAGKGIYKEEQVIVESTTKDDHVIVTKIINKKNPKLIMDFTTGKLMQANYEKGKVNRGSDCQDFKDFYEAIRNIEEESASPTEIFDKKLAKQEKELKRIQNKMDRLLRARFALEQTGDSK